jgi:hypothetical protein
MNTLLRRVLYGAIALVVLCFTLPSTVQADHRRDQDDRWGWREHVRRPNYYSFEPEYGYYEPGFGYYYYPRFGRYYGMPGYGNYQYPGGGNAVDAGRFHMRW